MKKLQRVFKILFLFFVISIISLQAKAAGSLYDAKTKQEVGKISPAIAKSNIEEEFNENMTYAISIKNQEPKTFSIPIHIPKDGILNFRLKNVNNNINGQLIYGFSEDGNSENILGSSKLNLDNSSSNAYLFLKKGDYHLTLAINTDDKTKDSYNFEFQALLCTTEMKTLKDSTITISAKGGETDYHKIKLTKPSIILLKGDILKEASFLKAMLYDSNKKAISKNFSLTDNSSVFTLDKGTYYFKISTDSKVYWMVPQIKTVSEKSGTSISKAKNIQINKTVSGIVALTDKKNKTDYYKISAKKAGQLKGIYILFNGQGKIKVTIQVPGSEEKSKILEAGRGLQHVLSEDVKSQKNQYPKGTYYIKIIKMDTSSSGTYTIGAKKYKK